MDYNTPLFDHHLAIRIFQADFQYTHENFPGGRGNFNMARLSAGFVYHIGTLTPPPPVTLSCTATPTSIFPGDHRAFRAFGQGRWTFGHTPLCPNVHQVASPALRLERGGA